MVKIYHGVLGLLLIQMYVGAAPSNITNIEEQITKTEETPQGENQEKSLESIHLEEPLKDTNSEETIEANPKESKPDSQPLPIEESKLDDNSTQIQRQKRFYDLFSYGAPPINPIVYPGYNKRDQSAEVGIYGLEDPLEQIHRRLHDIASFVRQPAPPPPPPSHFPFFFPVIYIPQFGCDCNSGGSTPPENPEIPQTPKPATNQTDPNPDKRFPDLSDDRQNWGFAVNETSTDTEYDEDEFARPISFDPIQPIRPMMRPAPPVEHGSSQGDSASPQSTTARPLSPPRQPSTSRPSAAPGSFAFGQPRQTPYPPSFSNDIPRNEQPSKCDGAILSCCHQPSLSYDCFVNQGCPDLRSYRSPCDPLVILQVIEKFQRFYGVRNKD